MIPNELQTKHLASSIWISLRRIWRRGVRLTLLETSRVTTRHKLHSTTLHYTTLLPLHFTTLHYTTLMKNRASYTLEIFKIFLFSFFFNLFGYHCIHHFFIIYFIIFIFLSFQVSFFIIFLIIFNHFFKSFFIIFSSSGAKIFQKMENYNVPQVFFMFLSFFSFVYDFFYHFCFQWWLMKNEKK